MAAFVIKTHYPPGRTWQTFRSSYILLCISTQDRHTETHYASTKSTLWVVRHQDSRMTLYFLLNVRRARVIKPPRALADVFRKKVKKYKTTSGYRLQEWIRWFLYREDQNSTSRLHDRKTEHFKALTKDRHTSVIADHISSTGHNIKWDHFETLTTGKSDIRCTIKEILLIRDLKPDLNENVGSEKLFLY